MKQNIALRCISTLLLTTLFALLQGCTTVHESINHYVRDALVNHGSAITGVPITIGSLDISPTSGLGSMNYLVISNPPGFTTAYALRTDEIQLSLAPETVNQEVVLIRRVAIIAPDMTYERLNGSSNIDLIQKNIAATLARRNPDKTVNKKFIIEEFRLMQGKARVNPGFLGAPGFTVNLPDLTLHDMGKAQGGLPPAELATEIAKAVKKQLLSSITPANVSISVKETAGKLLETVKGWLGH